MDTQKPDDIPDDIWGVVLEIAAPWVRGATIDREGISHQIARAIAAEREACRLIAAFKGNNANMLQNDNVEPDRYRLVRDVSFEIAAAISARSLTQA